MFQHQYAQINGLRLHYVTAGTGKLLLFLHGFPDFWYEWKDQLTHFQQRYTVVAPDMRGYNLSGKPAEVAGYQLPYLVEDVRALADHLGHIPFTLIAHDWGAGVAWAFASSYPEYLERLIVLSTPPIAVVRRSLRERPEQRRASTYLMMLNSPQAEQMLTAGDYSLFTQTIFGANVPAGYFTDADRAAYREAWAQPGAIRGGVNYYRAARLAEFFSEAECQASLERLTGPEGPIGAKQLYQGVTPREVLEMRAAFSPQAQPMYETVPVVSTPTLLIAGENDIFAVTRPFESFEQYASNATLKLIPEAGHRIVHERSSLVTAYIESFIENVSTNDR